MSKLDKKFTWKAPDVFKAAMKAKDKPDLKDAGKGAGKASDVDKASDAVNLKKSEKKTFGCS